MTDRIKTNGIHYTPPELATFLAAEIRARARRTRGPIRILDPACGQGSLLRAIVLAFPKSTRRRMLLTGYETDVEALRVARDTLCGIGARKVELIPGDFLVAEEVSGNSRLDGVCAAERNAYDLVIANPPYVRTQVLGADQSQLLAKRFGLKGRVDLYHAFAVAMATVMKPGGTLGLLTSNRFLTIRSGEALRRYLREEFALQAIHDLGDTKLFSAAVLPVVVVATRRSRKTLNQEPLTVFTRAYQAKSNGPGATQFEHVLQAIRDEVSCGLIETRSGFFQLQRGVLPAASAAEAVWSLSTPTSDEWLQDIQRARACTVGDVAEVRVGIKTTADKVFVRGDWQALPEEQRPESDLLRPLITHQEASRWLAHRSPVRQVLYPHEQLGAKRIAVDLRQFPRARAYLKSHEKALRARKYVIDSGRSWYEIWVPHRPSHWSREKLIFPDISEQPKFFFDKGSSVVQGDCYWIVTKDDAPSDWLYVVLAVCNSSFAVKFYDTAFHNKLYSGRRRFMTQYVKQFPLPPLENRWTRELIRKTKTLLEAGPTESAERRLDALVWKAFGFTKGQDRESK